MCCLGTCITWCNEEEILMRVRHFYWRSVVVNSSMTSQMMIRERTEHSHLRHCRVPTSDRLAFQIWKDLSLHFFFARTGILIRKKDMPIYYYMGLSISCCYITHVVESITAKKRLQQFYGMQLCKNDIVLWFSSSNFSWFLHVTLSKY